MGIGIDLFFVRGSKLTSFCVRAEDYLDGNLIRFCVRAENELFLLWRLIGLVFV